MFGRAFWLRHLITSNKKVLVADCGAPSPAGESRNESEPVQFWQDCRAGGSPVDGDSRGHKMNAWSHGARHFPRCVPTFVMAERALRRWPRTLAVLVFFALAYYMLLRWFEYRQVFQPYSTIQVDGRDLGRPWENIYFMAADGPRLNGWFFPAGAQSRRVRLVVLHCHGNGGNISHRLGDYEALLALGVNVLGFDYRGYGQSEGKPSEEGTYVDAQAALRWLCQKGFGPTNIIVMGESLGGAVAAELALRKKWADWSSRARSPASRMWAPNSFPGCRCVGSLRSVTTRMPNCRGCACRS